MTSTRQKVRAVLLLAIMLGSVVTLSAPGLATTVSKTTVADPGSDSPIPGDTQNVLDLTVESEDSVITAGSGGGTAEAGDPTEAFAGETATTPELFVDDGSEPASPTAGAYEDGDDVLTLTELTSPTDNYEAQGIHDFATADPSTRYLDDDHDGQYDDGEAIVQDDSDDGILSTGLLSSSPDTVVTSGNADLNDFGTGNNFFIDAGADGSYNDGEAVLDDAGIRIVGLTRVIASSLEAPHCFRSSMPEKVILRTGTCT